ncbi:MAG: hypothetical protein PF488_00230 [Patescibacteria group bacterium]|jgi:hypothetical protein|nr:hypothetical protein [Patescibacteria group bacterium]
MNKIILSVITGLTIFLFLFLSFFVFIIIRSNIIDIGNQRIDYFLLFKDLIFVILWLLLIPLILKLFKKSNKIEEEK